MYWASAGHTSRNEPLMSRDPTSRIRRMPAPWVWNSSSPSCIALGCMDGPPLQIGCCLLSVTKLVNELFNDSPFDGAECQPTHQVTLQGHHEGNDRQHD